MEALLQTLQDHYHHYYNHTTIGRQTQESREPDTVDKCW